MFGNTKFSENSEKKPIRHVHLDGVRTPVFVVFFFRRFVEFFLTVGICFEDAEVVDNLEQRSLEALREMMDIGKHFHTWPFLHFSIRKTLLG